MNDGPTTAQRAAIGIVLGIMAGAVARWSVGGVRPLPSGIRLGGRRR